MELLPSETRRAGGLRLALDVFAPMLHVAPNAFVYVYTHIYMYIYDIYI